ncbi:unnamed protein product, partial [Aphanomyces euteiches]
MSKAPWIWLERHKDSMLGLGAKVDLDVGGRSPFLCIRRIRIRDVSCTPPNVQRSQPVPSSNTPTTIQLTSTTKYPHKASRNTSASRRKPPSFSQSTSVNAQYLARALLLGMKLKHLHMQQENAAEDPTQPKRNLYVEDVERRRRILETGVTEEDIYAAHYKSTKIYEGRADTDGEVEDKDLEAHQVRENCKLGRPEDYQPPERTPHRIDEANRMWDGILLTQALSSNPPQHQARQQEQQERQQHQQFPTQILHG